MRRVLAFLLPIVAATNSSSSSSAAVDLCDHASEFEMDTNNCLDSENFPGGNSVRCCFICLNTTHFNDAAYYQAGAPRTFRVEEPSTAFTVNCTLNYPCQLNPNGPGCAELGFGGTTSSSSSTTDGAGPNPTNATTGSSTSSDATVVAAGTQSSAADGSPTAANNAGSATNNDGQSEGQTTDAKDLIDATKGVKDAPAAATNVTKTEFTLASTSYGCGTMCQDDTTTKTDTNTTTDGNATRRQLATHIVGVSATGCKTIFGVYKTAYETAVNALTGQGTEKDYYLTMMMATCVATDGVIIQSSIITYKDGASAKLTDTLAKTPSAAMTATLKVAIKAAGGDDTKLKTLAPTVLTADDPLVKALKTAAAKGKASVLVYQGNTCQGATPSVVWEDKKINEDHAAAAPAAACMKVSECVSGSYASVQFGETCAELATSDKYIIIPDTCSQAGGVKVIVSCKDNSFGTLAATNPGLKDAATAKVEAAIAAAKAPTTTSGAFSSGLSALAFMLMAFLNM